jgi:hypothetical protein
MENNVEVHHPSIENIMGTPPAIMVRMGSEILFSVIIGLFLGSAFFTYQDTILSQAILQGGSPPSTLIASQNGKIIQSGESGPVKYGDTIMWMEVSSEQLPVKATASGFLEINPVIDLQKNLRENDTIGRIWESVPSVCVIRLTPEQVKHVQKGNKIRLHFDRYPSEQYGTVETEIKAISQFSSGKDFEVLAELPYPTVTSDQVELTIYGCLYASAEIITGEKSLFHRLINPFRGLTKR